MNELENPFNYNNTNFLVEGKMVLRNTETNYNPEHPKNWVWYKIFAWIPVRVDDGRVVWLEYVFKTKPKNEKAVYKTRKFPIDFEQTNGGGWR